MASQSLFESLILLAKPLVFLKGCLEFGWIPRGFGIARTELASRLQHDDWTGFGVGSTIVSLGPQCRGFARQRVEFHRQCHCGSTGDRFAVCCSDKESQRRKIFASPSTPTLSADPAPQRK